MFTSSVTAIGLQLFLGGINELFSTTGLNMTVVMASSFAPVPLTIWVYNAIVKKKGLGFGYRYVLTIFAIGMGVLFLCGVLSGKVSMGTLTLIALCGGLFISFSIGAFFSVTYTVPSHVAQVEYEKSGKMVSGMFFAVQGVFEGIAAGIATGFILVTLKDYDCILLLPIIVIVCCVAAFLMSFLFDKDIAYMGKEKQN